MKIPRRASVLVTLIAGLAIRLLSAPLDADGYVRDWLISGPYPNYLQDSGATTGYDTDFLLDVEGEEYVIPELNVPRPVDFVADKAKLIAGIGSVNEWNRTQTFSVDAAWQKRTLEPIAQTDNLFDGVTDYYVFYAACYLYSAHETDAVIAVGSDDYNKVWLNDSLIGCRETSQGVSPGAFPYSTRLRAGINKLLVKIVDVTGDSGFCVQVLDKSGKPLHVDVRQTVPGVETEALSRALHPPRTREQLVLERDQLKKQIARVEGEVVRLNRDVEALTNARDRMRARQRESFARAELRLEQERRKNLVGAPRSCDLPLPAGRERRRLCLNGIWQGSKDAVNRHYEPVRVPFMAYDSYFLRFNFPVDRKGNSLSEWKDWKINPIQVIGKNPVRLRTTFEWAGKSSVSFVSEAVLGRVQVFCNGMSCGVYDGIVGELRFDLAGLRVGENVLELEWKPPRNGKNCGVGPVGDIYLEYGSPVRTVDALVTTSWTKATLNAELEIENLTGQERQIEVRSRVVEKNRVRLELPVSRFRVAAGSRKTSRVSSKWADPKFWGIGGVYGEPDLYELVTDVYADGEQVDRHRVSFGFREFCIVHTEFFLNGKRIVLQGDVGNMRFDLKRVREIGWNALREDGVNIIRTHDNAYWSLPLVCDADRMGMLVYAQMYPMLNPTPKVDKRDFIGYDAWFETETHEWNLSNYRRWWRMFRNHPSVVLWSTDNEILTQAWDTAADAEYNVRSDRLAAYYEKFVKSLQPSLIMTRDGDLGTLNHRQRWFEDPPCDTANYHYPDFSLDKVVTNWRSLYEWRPVVWGETLYCSFGAWDGWIGPVPEQIAKKAAKVRRVVSLYREEEVPAQIFMGLSMDGYAIQDDSGKGNPWGITASEKKHYETCGMPPSRFPSRTFPWLQLSWPSESGVGLRDPAWRLDAWCYTGSLMNCYDARYPSVVRNAVAEAYRATLLPQSPLRTGQTCELLVVDAVPGEAVWVISAETGIPVGVRADAMGRAWFRGLYPGKYRVCAKDASCDIKLRADGPSVLKPGFRNLQKVALAHHEEGR